MGNPVFSKLESQWSSPSAYPSANPTTPGYQPGYGAAPMATGGSSNPYADMRTGSVYTPDQVDPNVYAQMEASYAAPAADAVDRGVMTYDDVIMKTGISFGVMLIAAALSWVVTLINPMIGMVMMGVGLIVGLVLALVVSFSKKVRPALILAYAVFEGLALGAISAISEFQFPGIVIQALVATVAVFGVTLALFVSGKVRNSSKLMKFTLISIVGILVYRLLSMVLTLAGVIPSGGFDNVTIFGLPLGLVVGVFAVFVGAASLIQDFDQAKVGVERGVSAKYAWLCAFGILVTVVWMYLEILRILSRLRN